MIARLMTEYFVVVTGPDSQFKSFDEVMTAIKSDPARVAVGAANDDHAPFDLLVFAAGGDPSSVNYVDLEGGGDQSAALLSGDISVAIGGVSEFIGQLKSKGLVTLSKWRGLYGPPGMPDFAVDYWQKALAAMVTSPTWNQIAEQNQFATTFMIGDEFQTFLAETQAEVKAALEEAGQ